MHIRLGCSRVQTVQNNLDFPIRFYTSFLRCFCVYLYESIQIEQLNNMIHARGSNGAFVSESTREHTHTHSAFVRALETACNPHFNSIPLAKKYIEHVQHVEQCHFNMQLSKHDSNYHPGNNNILVLNNSKRNRHKSLFGESLARIPRCLAQRLLHKQNHFH